MLLIDIPRIPPEGLDLDEALDPVAVHLDGDAELSLRTGGRLCGHVEVVDGATLHVRGRLEAAVEIDCARCLERYGVALGQELDLFYLPRAAEQEEAQEEEVELSDRDVVVGYYENDRLDLGEVVREQILLGLPLKPLCREDCLGLCPACGLLLARGAPRLSRLEPSGPARPLRFARHEGNTCVRACTPRRETRRRVPPVAASRLNFLRFSRSFFGTQTSMKCRKLPEPDPTRLPLSRLSERS